ncbi:MAG: T9SS type B sorting domain-containing protein [Flavisolibacter sp.]
MKRLLITLLSLFSICLLRAQTCTTPGQTPSTAFPVCGTSIFQQTTVPICSSHDLTVPGCNGDGAAYADKNPYWYKFTCYQSGTLGFLIAPKNQGDDYDWQLFDITGHQPDDVFTDKSLIVTGNWAGTLGNTGASPSGVSFIQCASMPAEKKNSFSQMPQIVKGHTYLLLVSHFTDSQSGYNLSFKGGTAIINDPTPPALKTAEANCGGNLLHIKLNKKIKCSSLATDGSDFSVTPGTPGITSVTGIGCSSGFETDSIELQLSTFLGPGSYSLNVKKGSDGNTLLDFCDNALSDTASMGFTVYPLVPTPLDSLSQPTCAPQTLHLVFRKPILCSSVAANGSDFSLSGTYPATIDEALINCVNGSSSKEITLHLSQPLYQNGSFKLILQSGSDGNTILDECGKETPAGSSLVFEVKDTVDARFNYEKRYGCTVDTVNFFHKGGNGVSSWQWDLGDNQTSLLQQTQGVYSTFDDKQVSLVVSNGFCTDTSTQTISLDNFLKADFSAYADDCPNEPVAFTSTAQGHIVAHQWSFGDGGSSGLESPSHIYAQPYNSTPFSVRYTVTDSLGCTSAVQKIITVYSSCYLAVPNAFTPNNDGKNDFLRVLNAIKAEKLEFRIFNRWGQLVFHTNNWKQGWDGTVGGVPQGSGVYVWFLTYTHRDTKEVRTMKGTATLIR